MVDSKKSTFRFRLRLRQFGKNKAPCGCGLVTITRRNPLLEFEMHFHTSHKEVNTNIQLQTTSIYVESANKLFHKH